MRFLSDRDEDVIAWVSDHLDRLAGKLYQDQPLAQDWARVSKVQEELGEAIGELILATDQNPRKQGLGDRARLHDELADTALTAIFALQHFTGNALTTSRLLGEKLEAIYVRAQQIELDWERKGL